MLKRIQSALLDAKESNHGSAINKMFSILAELQTDNNVLEDMIDIFEECLTNCLVSFTQQLLLTNNNIERDNQVKWLWNRSLELTKYKSKQLISNYVSFLMRNKNSIKLSLLFAKDILLNVLSIYPHYGPFVESYENIKSTIVDRWHFRMLNDSTRNQAYKNAIEYQINCIKYRIGKEDKCVVLDIGGGTGLLSMYAIQAGADHCYCCEVSEEMAIIAKECIKNNGFSDKITVINKYSTHLTVNPFNAISVDKNMNDVYDLPCKMSLIITELVDSGLLGEHIIPVLRDAAHRLLQPHGAIIPYSTSIYGKPIQSSYIASKQSIINPSNHDNIYTDDNSHRASRDCFYQNIDSVFGAPFCNRKNDQEYTCENGLTLPYLSFVEHPLHLLDINFHHEASLPTSSTGHHANIVSFSSVTAGILDGYLYWFRLNLLPLSNYDDHDTRFSFDTAPGRAECGWDQAVLFNNDDLSRVKYIIAEEPYELQVSFSDNRIRINCNHSNCNNNEYHTRLDGIIHQ
eukprot:gene8212-11112_t